MIPREVTVTKGSYYVVSMAKTVVNEWIFFEV